MKKMNMKGFTIVELVIVIAVIAILAAVMIPTFSGIVNKANQSKALQEVKAAYTVYLSETLAGQGTSEDKIYVEHGNGSTTTIISITNGQAKVEAAGWDSTGYTEYEIADNTYGDKTLEIAN